jgi:hypothetical protein
MGPTVAAGPANGHTRNDPDAEPGPLQWDLALQVDRRPELREESFPDAGWTCISGPTDLV